MIVLGIIIAALAGYLVYALIYPENCNTESRGKDQEEKKCYRLF